MTDILLQLESATGPSREIDAEIGRLCGYEVRNILDGKVAPNIIESGVGWLMRKPWESKWTPLTRYSQDEGKALLALPEWVTWEAGNCGDGDGPWACLTNSRTLNDYRATGATVAIAILAAIVKARTDYGTLTA